MIAKRLWREWFVPMASCRSKDPPAIRRFLAKLYGSLRTGGPVFALTDPIEDTARRLAKTGVGTIVPLGDAVERKFPVFLRILRKPRAPVGTMSKVVRCARRARTGEVAAPLDGVSW